MATQAWSGISSLETQHKTHNRSSRREKNEEKHKLVHTINRSLDNESTHL
jgi:hypothetical protein